MNRYLVLVADGAELDAGGWIPFILALDRLNLGTVLAGAGVDFPEERRRAGLADPESLAVLLMHGADLAGYVHLTRDWRDPADLYVASVQIAPQFRGSMSFAILLAAARDEARELPFRRITSNIQPTNTLMLDLARRLGLTLTPLADRPSVEVTAGREWLDSPAVHRIARRYEG